MAMCGGRSVGWLLVAVAGIAVALSGCSLSAPAPTASGHSASAQPVESSPTPEPSFGPNAVVSIAGVDVDGRNVTVAGFVSGVSEPAGTCRFVLTSGLTGVDVDAVTTGQDNGSNTSCRAAQIPMEQVSKGPWSVVLHYTSSTVTLDSARVELEIP